jgi:hypothetical protein
MKLTHRFAQPHLRNGRRIRTWTGPACASKLWSTAANIPTPRPRPIKLVDAQGRSCIFVPITQNGKVVDSQGYILDLEDE